MQLFDFAYCPNYDTKIAILATLCPEKWSFGANSDNVILKNYMKHTFSKVEEEGKILIEPSKYALLNTGLFTQRYEPVFAYFEPNRNPDKQAWCLTGFQTKYQLGLLGITEFPSRANYFQNPADFVFDVNCEIIPQYGHIFDDPENFSRIPESVRDNPAKRFIFDGAIERAKLMINANYKTAIPQYYKGKIQLLIPICLTSENAPDLALVVSKNDNTYLGHTCLTLDMAYNNARLIARPDSIWLKP